MNTTQELSKLAEIRTKTDRDLVVIINNGLEVALLLAANESDVDPEGILHRKAADIYANTAMLVQQIEDLRERRRLEDKLRQLGERLHRRMLVQAGASA